MKKEVQGLLWGVPLMLMCLFAVLIRPQVMPVQAPVLLGEKDGVRVYAGAEQGDALVRCTREQLLRGNLLMVSPEHPLPSDFPAPNVRSVQAVVGEYFPSEGDVVLDRDCIQALCDMRMDHALDGMRVIRGALSKAQQHALWRACLMDYMQTYDLRQAAALAQADVPLGGESEHQLGTVFDLQWTGVAEMGNSDQMIQTEEGVWLRDHMWQYGFIRRYGPEHAAREEGNCENLHIRYVGTVHSSIMHACDWCLEMYLHALHQYGALTLVREGQDDVRVYAVPYAGQGEWTVQLPQGQYQCSSDNDGYAIFW